MSIIIRPIEKRDNQQIAAVIRKVFVDLDVPKVGTAYEDKALDCMFETYNTSGAAYFVVDFEGEIIGGAGIAKLDNYDGNVCELQKMYFLEKARGKGLGTQMMSKCLEKAVAFNYDKCYLETMTFMEDAQKLYKKVGFEYLEKPMGDTGHYSCSAQMLKTL